MAVSSNNTANLSRTTNINQKTSDWTICMWCKENTYPTSNTYDSMFGFIAGTPNVDRVFIGAQNGDNLGYGSQNTLISYIYDDFGAGTTTDQNLLTGGDTAWVFVAITHAANSSTINWYYRKESVGSLSTFSLTDPAGFSNNNAVANIFTDAASEQMHDGSMAYYRIWTSALNSTQLLTESTSTSAVITTNLYCDLPMSSVATAGTDSSGNSNNFTVTNTLTLATNPNITLGPSGPTINTQPQSQSIYSGSTATFTVSATSSSGTLHYQWKQNGTNVGTDSNSYTTPSNTLSNNGDIYTVVVTDDNGNVTSNNAILTVLPAFQIGWFKC